VTPTLLLADDSLTIRRVIELTFADEDIRVLAVNDGREAIARIVAEPPDIILADAGMPERDGYEVAAFVKGNERFAHIPVVLLTGAFEPIDEARAREVGCDGVLVKPFEPQMVISRVKELLAGSGARPRTAPVSGDDYFERLDAAFAAMSSFPRQSGPTPRVSGDGDGDDGRPEPRARIEDPREAPAPVAARQADPGPSAGISQAVRTEQLPPSSMAQAFAALLAAEQGKATSAGLPFPVPAISDAMLDDIATRVIARLGSDSMRQAVLDAAERLVKEEIERIKRPR
jgi:CheY-like chemotaxis protein